MKKLLTLITVGGLFAAITLQAQVNIYIAGSTAFRATAFRAIKNAFDGGVTYNPSTAGGGTSIVTFKGTMTSLFGAGVTVKVYCSYNGSVQGLGDLANNTSLTFTNAPGDGAGNVSIAPNITFSDVDHVSTLFPSVPVTETHIAVLPFVYCRNYYTPTTVTNITDKQLQALWGSGSLPLSLITGNTNDTSLIYVTGRNLDSGTRVCGTADANYTAFTTTPTLWGFNAAPENPAIWAELNQNLSGTTYGYGYSSGGNEAAALTNQNATVSATGVACVGYLGLSDALTVTGSASTGAPQNFGGGNCSVIAYNGVLPFKAYTPGSSPVPANPDFSPILSGQYSFWSYECLETLSTHGPGDGVYQYYTNLVAAIDNDILQAKNNGGNSSTYGPVTAIRLSDMQANRSSVGGTITPGQ